MSFRHLQLNVSKMKLNILLPRLLPVQCSPPQQRAMPPADQETLDQGTLSSATVFQLSAELSLWTLRIRTFWAKWNLDLSSPTSHSLGLPAAKTLSSMGLGLLIQVLSRVGIFPLDCEAWRKEGAHSDYSVFLQCKVGTTKWKLKTLFSTSSDISQSLHSSMITGAIIIYTILH